MKHRMETIVPLSVRGLLTVTRPKAETRLVCCCREFGANSPSYSLERQIEQCSLHGTAPPMLANVGVSGPFSFS